MRIEIKYTNITTEDWNRIGAEWPKQKGFRYSFILSNYFGARWNIHLLKDELKKITEWHDDYTLLEEDYMDEMISIEQYSDFESSENVFKVHLSHDEIINLIKGRNTYRLCTKENEILDWCQENINDDFFLSLEGDFDLYIYINELGAESYECELKFDGFLQINFMDDISAMGYKLRW